MKYVNQPVRKTDAMSLVTGKPVYTDDQAPRDCLIVKILRSPHANAWVEDIKTGTAEKVAGIACILTYKDVPQKRFTLAGQTAPEMSPDDRLIIDRHVRFVGDVVAIVAGETEEAVDLAHPLTVTAGEVIIDGDDVHALAGERVEIRRQDGDEGLALAGLHLGDAALMQHDAADELHPVGAQAQHPVRCLPDGGKGLGEHVVERLTVGVALTELIGLGAELLLGHLLKLGLKTVDLVDDLVVALKVLIGSKGQQL